MASPSTPLLSKKTQSTLPALTIEAEKRRFQGRDDGNLEEGRRGKTEGKEEIKLRLFRAAISGQSELVEEIYKVDPGVVNEEITKHGETALHVAAAAGHTEFVRKLIEKMRPSALRMKHGPEEKKELDGSTAFCHAAISGTVEIAEIMLQADKCLVNIRGKGGALPLHMAALFGHKKMVKYLYKETATNDGESKKLHKMNPEERTNLLLALIDSGIYDVAIKVVNAHPELAAPVDKNGKTAFNKLARKSFDHQTLRIAWKNGINLCDGKEAEEEDYDKLLELVWKKLLRCNNSTIFDVIMNGSDTSQESGNDSNTSQADGKDSWMSKDIKSYNHETAQGNVEFHTTLTGPSQVIKSYNQAIFTAAAQENVDFLTTLTGPSQVTKSYNQAIFTAAAEGNVKFLVKLIGSYPDFLFEFDENMHSIFHIAVLHRQEHVFALINSIGTIKYFLAIPTNKGNNMLHLAGELSPQSRLDAIPGAAFQLQRELLWFEEVKKLVKPEYIEAKNDEGHTPRDLFRKRHKKLIDDGKTWMKETASQCMLVATFIAGVAFASALSVPGGTDGGVPVLLKQTSFQVFTVADGLSLIFTITAVLHFFSILTSRNKLDDYMQSLPNKLVFGLGPLFLSIVALMVAFGAAFFILFRDGKLGYFVPIAALAPIPILFFICQQYSLMRDMIRATYDSKSLFQPNKNSLLSEWKKPNESLPKSQGTNL